MPSRYPSPRARRLFTLAALLLCYCCAPRPASGQVPNFGNSGQTRAPNPQVSVTRAPARRAESRAKRTPGGPAQPAPDARAEEKQQAVEQAIAAGNEARDRNDYEQALRHYQTARDLSPQDVRALYGIGNLYADLFCHDSAIVAYVDALKLKKDYPEALVGLGWAYFGKERYDEAGEQFQAALKLNPKNVEANLGLGHVYSKKRKYDEAAARMNLVIDDPGADAKQRALGRLSLGGVYWNQEKHPEAIEQFKQAINLKPDLARAYVDLGNAQMTAAHAWLVSLGFTDIKQADPQHRAALSAAARDAAANFEKARQSNFNHPILYQSLGMALAYQSRYEEASAKFEEYFAEVRRLAARLSGLDAKCDAGFSRLNAEGHWYRGYVYCLEAMYDAGEQRKAELRDKSVEQFQQAVKLKPDFTNAYAMLGTLYWSQNKIDDAISHYEKALRFTTNDTASANLYRSLGSVYSQKGDRDKAVKHVLESIRLDPTHPGSYETLASLYVSQGKLQETLEALNKATELRKEPGPNPGPYHYLGVTYAIRFMKQKNEKDFQEAVGLLKKAVEIRPNDPSYHQALAIVYNSHGDGDEAVASYKKAIEYDPKNASFHYDLANVYANLKKNKEAAIESLRKAVELKPDYAEAHRYLGVMYYRRDSKDLAPVFAQLRKAVELDPKLVQAHYDLAFHYKAQKNYADAVKHLKTATELASDDYYPYKELAKVYEEQQKAEEAVRYYEEAMNRVKDDDAATKNLYRGRIERLRGRYAEAIALFQKVNYPDEPGQSHFEIGVVHVLSKNKKAALEQHQQLVRLKSPLADELMVKIKEMK